MRPGVKDGRGVAALLTSAALFAGCLVAPSAGAAEPRIVGGSTTTIEEWPWQVAIAEPPSSGGNGYQRQFCGGSLIGPTIVLTAAHCVYGSTGFSYPPSAFSVITGRTVLSSNAGAEIAAKDLFYLVDGGGGTPVPESQTQPGEGDELYDDASSEWDVALLELASAAPAPAAPIALAAASERSFWEAGDPAWVTGWGSTGGAAGPYPDDLREAEVEIVSDPDCDTAYPFDFDPETMVCAGIYPAGGKDTCQGDSGGPLVVPAGDGSFRLVGDTSFGQGCALPNFPGVYGRVADDPMRSAIQTAVSAALSSEPYPAPPPPPGGGGGGTQPPPAAGEVEKDEVAPETALGSRPAKRTRRRAARFVFSSEESGVSFRCSLDTAQLEPCTSPFVKRVKRRQRHTFAVGAVDAVGNADQTPAVYSWRVKRRR